MIRTFLLLLNALLVTGCQVHGPLSEQDSRIVLIVDDFPHISDTLLLKRGAIIHRYSLPAVCMYDALRCVDYPVRPIADTLELQVAGRQAVVRYRVNSLEQWDVPLRAGDTVVCSYEKGHPVFHLKNRRASHVDLNYDLLRRQRFPTDGFPADVQFRNPTLIYLLTSADWKQMPSYEALKKAACRRYTEHLESEKTWLDSLFRQGLLGDFEYRYFDRRNSCYRLFAQLDYQPLTVLKTHLAGYTDSIYVNRLYPFYREYFDALVEKLYYGEQLEASAQGIDYNYKVIFDRIVQDTLLTGRLRDNHLYRCFRKIDELFSISDGKKYYDRVEKGLRDTAILNNLHHNYGAVYSRGIVFTNDLTLQDVAGNTVMYKDVLSANAGKVIYVDFWASWCAPCMAAMPASERLREDYRDKDVVFVYLAFNDQIETWKAALSKAALGEVSTCYLVLNPRTSKLVEILKLNSIPRYLIYDKQGRLVNANAPLPKSKEIRSLINSYL